MGWLAAIYRRTIGWLLNDQWLSMGWLWAGHGLGYGLSIGYIYTYELAMGWLWTGYGVSISCLSASCIYQLAMA